MEKQFLMKRTSHKVGVIRYYWNSRFNKQRVYKLMELLPFTLRQQYALNKPLIMFQKVCQLKKIFD